MLRGFGGGISRHTEGTNMSRPPGPVTSHLLRCELSFRMPSFPFKIPIWSTKQKIPTEKKLIYPCNAPLITLSVGVYLCVREKEYPTWSCLKSHMASTMTGLLLFSSGLRGFSLIMLLDLLTRLWTCLLLSTTRSFSFCKHANITSVLLTEPLYTATVNQSSKREFRQQTADTMHRNSIVSFKKLAKPVQQTV